MLSRFKQVMLPSLLTLVLGVAIGFSFIGTVSPAHSQSAVDPQTQLLRDIYTRVNPSVVSIDVRIPATTTQRGLQQNGQQYQEAAGSGFVYDTNGHIATNAHVVEGADRIEVTFSDGNTFRAKVTGVDADADLAVIQAEGDISAYKPVPLANSDQVVVGDQAIAIGNPFRRSGTMTTGIVSGIHRSVQGTVANYVIPDAIQTDAAINPGNSGGPLLDAQGQVIGINEQIESQVRQSSGVSFAIPSNLVKQVSDALIQNGKVVHTYLGVAGGSLTLDITDALKLPANTHGVYITQVVPGGPAAKAGLRAATAANASTTADEVPTGSDIIIAVDKQPVRSFDDLTSYLFTKTKVGQKVTLTVLRDGKQQDISVTLDARPVTNSQ